MGGITTMSATGHDSQNEVRSPLIGWDSMLLNADVAHNLDFLATYVMKKKKSKIIFQQIIFIFSYWILYRDTVKKKIHTVIQFFCHTAMPYIISVSVPKLVKLLLLLKIRIPIEESELKYLN